MWHDDRVRDRIDNAGQYISINLHPLMLNQIHYRPYLHLVWSRPQPARHDLHDREQPAVRVTDFPGIRAQHLAAGGRSEQGSLADPCRTRLLRLTGPGQSIGIVKLRGGLASAIGAKVASAGLRCVSPHVEPVAIRELTDEVTI